MKKLSKIKLNVLSDEALSEKQMSKVAGGYFCVCGACGRYGSSEQDNENANSENDLKTDGKCTNWWNWV